MMTLLWNNDTKRLEFENGEPIGARPVNTALADHGLPAVSSFIEATAKSKERAASQFALDARTVRKLLKVSTIKKNNGKHKMPHLMGDGGSWIAPTGARDHYGTWDHDG